MNLKGWRVPLSPIHCSVATPPDVDVTDGVTDVSVQKLMPG